MNTTTTAKNQMSVTENLVAASAAFIDLARKESPAAPSAKLAKAFYRFVYWQNRVQGGGSWIAGRLATGFRDELMGGYYNTHPEVWKKAVKEAVDWASR